MPFTFKKFDLEGLTLITPQIFKDSRGFFLETYKQSEFMLKGLDMKFVQDNHSYSTKGVLRGIHFQNHPKEMGKLVRCINGKIWDVAVDLRPSSPTFKKWVGVELSQDNKQMLYIPPGFGHVFNTLSDIAEITYKCTNEYDPKLDGGIIWNDPEIGITWGIENPIISEKDSKLPYLKEI